MCGVPIFILTCKPFQNTKLLSGALPDPCRFPPATCWADRGGGWLRIFLGVWKWDGVSLGYPTSMYVTWWNAGSGWGSFRREHSKNLCRTIIPKLLLTLNLKCWRLYYVVVFHFCHTSESFTNHCVFLIFSGLFLPFSLWDNPILAGHSSQREKSLPCSRPLVCSAWHGFLSSLTLLPPVEKYI